VIYFLFLFLLPFHLFAELPEPESVQTYLDLFQFSRGGNTLRLGGELQLDGYGYLKHSNEDSQFLVRRARLDFDVTFQDTFHLLFQPKFINQERVEMDHAFIETSYPKYAVVRVGQIKEPISLQALQSSYFLNFIDRSLIVNFLQIYDVV
jgi:phosphate-selective porin